LRPAKLPRFPGAGLDLMPLVDAMKPPQTDPAVWLFDTSDGSPLQRVSSSRLQVVQSAAGIVLTDHGKIRGYFGNGVIDTQR
jgi:hypothetical protein